MIPFKVVGIGPGSRDYLLPVALDAIRNADFLIGSPRLLEIFNNLGKEVFSYRSNLPALMDFIEEQRQTQNIAILVSGDPGYHSLLGAVSRRFPEDAYEVIPGISSFQVAMARRKKSWQHDLLVSCHGKDFGIIKQAVLDALRTDRRVIFLTDYRWNPSAIAAELVAAGITVHRIWLAENLTTPEERFMEVTLEELAVESRVAADKNGTDSNLGSTGGTVENKKEYRLCVMIIE